MATTDDGVPERLTDIRRGNEDAIADLWRRYGDRLRGIARQHLGPARPVLDSEDIANAAFNSLIRSLRDPNLHDPRDTSSTVNSSTASLSPDEWKNGIWPIALGIARNKAMEANRRELAAKRGGGYQHASTDRNMVEDSTTSQPHVMALVQEQIEVLHRYVQEKPRLQEILQLRLEGIASNQIAATLGISEASVCRRLAEIRRVLEEYGNG